MAIEEFNKCIVIPQLKMDEEKSKIYMPSTIDEKFFHIIDNITKIDGIYYYFKDDMLFLKFFMMKFLDNNENIYYTDLDKRYFKV